MDPSNLSQPHGRFGFFKRLLLWIAAADLETLRHCPERDRDCLAAVGAILLGCFIYQSTLFFIVGQTFVQPGQIPLQNLTVAICLAVLILLVDRFAVIRSSHNERGHVELKRGGVDLGDTTDIRIKNFIFLGLRIGLFSLSFALLTGVFLSLLILHQDIDARIQREFQSANAPLIAGATARTDAAIQRATDDVAAETKVVNGLSDQASALRQGEIDPSAGNPRIVDAQKAVDQLTARKAKAEDDVRSAQTLASSEAGGIRANGTSGIPGDGPRARAARQQVIDAKAYAQKLDGDLQAANDRLEAARKQSDAEADGIKQHSHDQLSVFEQSQATENAKLEGLKADLSSLIQNREATIREEVQEAPGFVNIDAGLLSRIRILEQLADEDPWRKAMIIVLEIASFALETAAILSTTIAYCPTTYSARLAADHQLELSKIGDNLMAALRRLDDHGPEEPSGNPFGPDDPDGPQPRPPRANGHAAASPDDSGLFGNSSVAAPQPLRRKRGRPRKYPLPTTGGNGQGH